MGLRSSISSVLAAAALLSACTLFSRPQPDLRLLYQDSAQNQDRNPVILIPGLMGSRLERASDQTPVWGAFTKEAVDWSQPAGMRALMLDLWEQPPGFDHTRVASLSDDVVATGPLARVRADLFFGIVSVRVYASIIGVLGIGGYVDEAFAPLDYGPEHFNCYTFFYDWRKDNVANAQALGRFIDEIRPQIAEGRRKLGLPERPVKFDVVAHSMGALIARYYLRYGTEDVLDGPLPPVTWAGAKDIHRLILVAPPNLGSMQTLQALVQGEKRGLFLPRFQPAMLAGMPAIYQLLPRERHRPLVNPRGERQEIPFMNVETWLRNDWGPFAPDQEEYLRQIFPHLASPEERRQRMAVFVRAFLERAKRFAAALDQPLATPPPGTQIVLFAGDAEPTLDRALVVEQEGRLTLRFHSRGSPSLTAPGDGTITRTSALADERLPEDPRPWIVSPVPWGSTFFISDNHLGLTKNPNFQDNLLHILLERQPWGAPPVGTERLGGLGRGEVDPSGTVHPPAGTPGSQSPPR